MFLTRRLIVFLLSKTKLEIECISQSNCLGTAAPSKTNGSAIIIIYAFFF